MSNKKENTEEVSNMELELEAALKQAADNLNLAKYHKAEFENFKKRNADVSVQSYNDGRQVVIMEILPLMDSLHEALKTVETENDKEGIELLIRKFGQTFSKMGVEEFGVIGDAFDPRMHNAVATSEGKEPDIILEVWQKGYRMGAKVIRAAAVRVST